MTLRLLLICAVAVLLLSFGPPARAAAQVDIYQCPDSQTELRYRGLIDEFRCPKCLNTNLAGSDAPIAQDLRRTVRHQGAVPLNESEQRQIAAIVGTDDAGAHTEDAGAHAEDGDVNVEDGDVTGKDAGPQMEFDR